MLLVVTKRLKPDRDCSTYRKDIRLVRIFSTDNTEVVNCHKGEINPDGANFVFFSRLAFDFLVALDRV